MLPDQLFTRRVRARGKGPLLIPHACPRCASCIHHQPRARRGAHLITIAGANARPPLALTAAPLAPLSRGQSSPGGLALPGSWLGSRYPEHSAVVLAPTGLLFCMSEFGFCLPFTSEVWRMTECISPRVQQPTTDIQKSILNPAPANPAGQILD